VIDRLRFLLDRPLDPSAARAVIALGSAVMLGFAVLLVVGVAESGRSPAPRRQTAPVGSQSRQTLGHAQAEVAPAPTPAPHRRRQDPQDEKGSAAARSAARALRSHRALQHVPYRRGGVSIRLVGARGDRALLRVSAPSLAASRRGWRKFLRRFKDPGQAYVPVFTRDRVAPEKGR
jgi:hypothetical protein